MRSILTTLAALLFVASASAQATKPDVLVFTNGDQLTGKLLRAVGGNVVFKSDMAGEITIGFDKVKELRSGSDASQFAMLKKGAPITKVVAPEGTVALADGSITVTPANAAPVTMKPAEVAYLIDKPTYDKAIAHKTGFFSGWNGTASGGANIVRSSTVGTTLNAALNLFRDIPGVPFLPKRNRTTANINEAYGKLTQVAPAPALPTVKTSVFHADAERDEYFSPRLYALADVAFDHNFSQGLHLQQIYGGGIGWTVVQQPRQQLDVKADVHYEMQKFDDTPATPTTPVIPGVKNNIFGSTFAEAYRYNLPRKIVFTETGNFIPGWTDTRTYSANVTASLAMPVFKRLSASVTTTDNYLNNPPAGYNQNSYQFITGVTYNLR